MGAENGVIRRKGEGEGGDVGLEFQNNGVASQFSHSSKYSCEASVDHTSRVCVYSKKMVVATFEESGFYRPVRTAVAQQSVVCCRSAHPRRHFSLIHARRDPTTEREHGLVFCPEICARREGSRHRLFRRRITSKLPSHLGHRGRVFVTQRRVCGSFVGSGEERLSCMHTRRSRRS